MAYDPIEIFTEKDLKKQITLSIINADIIIRGEHLNRISGVTKINGFLGFSDSTIEILEDLLEITGDFWTSSNSVNLPLRSLGTLEKIGGDANLRYSNISDLGNLKYVGGKLSLRDTNINTLGKLSYVGGDLYLPKRLQNLVDLEEIQVNGKIKFWNDVKTKRTIRDKSLLNLSEAKMNVPFWAHQYIFSSNALKNTSSEQRKFYGYFKECFLNNLFIDLKGNDNYCFVLLYDLITEYQSHRNFELLVQHFLKLETFYPKTSNYTSLLIIEHSENSGDYETGWCFSRKREYISVKTIWEYEKKLKRKLLDGDLISKLGGYSHLTNFGQNNIESIKPFAEKYLIQYESANNSSFFDLFFDNNCLFKPVDGNYLDQYYHQYYLSESEYYHYKTIDDKQNISPTSTTIRHVVEKAVFNQLRVILKGAEDLYREEKGMPKVGEGWISETELYYKIKDRFKDYEVLHHAKPSWLGRQHLDIYLPELNISIEYQGLQHYEPIDFFGGKEAFIKNQERDERKRKLCQVNNCHLVYAKTNYDFDEIANEIDHKIKQTKSKH